MCMGTEGVSPAASQLTEVSERGYLEMPSAGDSVAQNAEAVKRDECLPENMDVEDDIPSNMDVMERQDGEFVHTFYMKKRKESAPQTFNAGVNGNNAADANSSDTSIRSAKQKSQEKFSADSSTATPQENDKAALAAWEKRVSAARAPMWRSFRTN